MQKFLTLILICISATVIGGVYGIIHDQFTYSISPEYYTKFKFFQFQLKDIGNEAIFSNPRIEVSIVGFMATWWMGFIIGFVLSIVGMVHENHFKMAKVTLNAIGIVIVITFFTGLIGLIYGKFYLAPIGVSWWLPENLVDKENFIAVGSMHNFSYLGGLIGLIVACIFSFKQKN